MALSLSVVILCYRAGKDVKGFVEEVVDCLEKEMDDWQIILVSGYRRCEEDLQDDLQTWRLPASSSSSPLLIP